jgi:hypothetical protein
VIQQETHPFNKIRLGGMEADLEGIAYQIELNNEGKPKAVLWYLSVVGHKIAVQAIWAGLVNTPPQPIGIYREEDLSTDENSEPAGQGENGAERGRKAIMMKLAEGWGSGGWNFLTTRLNTSYAYQGYFYQKPPFSYQQTRTGQAQAERMPPRHPQMPVQKEKFKPSCCFSNRLCCLSEIA